MSDAAALTAPEEVVLVDEEDRCIGYLDKLTAHQNGGVLHRAFSVFIFNRQGHMLLQRRAHGKYHSGGLWTNACCSHPRRGEEVGEAAHRRLREEFGFDVPLRQCFTFIYRALDPGSGLTEHEYDHVFVGHFDGEPSADREEIEEWRWVDVAELREAVAAHPERYTAWFRLALERVLRVEGWKV